MGCAQDALALGTYPYRHSQLPVFEPHSFEALHVRRAGLPANCIPPLLSCVQPPPTEVLRKGSGGLQILFLKATMCNPIAKTRPARRAPWLPFNVMQTQLLQMVWNIATFPG